MKHDLNKLVKEMFKDWTLIKNECGLFIGFEKDYLDGHVLNYVSRKNSQQLALNAEIGKMKARIDERETMWRSLVLNKVANHKTDKDYRLATLRQKLAELEKKKEGSDGKEARQQNEAPARSDGKKQRRPTDEANAEAGE